MASNSLDLFLSRPNNYSMKTEKIVPNSPLLLEFIRSSIKTNRENINYYPDTDIRLKTQHFPTNNHLLYSMPGPDHTSFEY